MSTPIVELVTRREAIRAQLPDLEVDVLLLTGAADVRYLSAFAGSNGQVLLGRSLADDRLLTDARYEGTARELSDLAVELTTDPLAAALAAAADGPSARARIGIDADAVSWATARRWQTRAAEADAELVAVRNPVPDAREVKDRAEIASLAVACQLTVQALEELFDDHVRVGASEIELATWLERRFVDLGAEAVAFPSIVASGPNAAVPHHVPGPRTLQAGDLLTVDCGARVDGYHADCTRTVAVGHLDEQLTEVHALVVAAQAAGRAAAVAGATTGSVDAAARTVIETAGYGERFVHGTGHGVGLEIHEQPAVAREASATLHPGTTLTVEPGVYLPGTGGVRIEDTIVVTADGAPRVLTDTPRELRVL